jgi:cytochrome b561
MAFLWSGALAIVSVGVAGLLHDLRHAQAAGSLINIPALFGLLLCGLVAARFYRRAKHSPLVVPADIRDFSRQLSRMVYLLLYLTIGVRQLICIVDHIWRGGYRDGFGPDEGFQVFVVYGLVALAVIRVLAFGIGLRVADDAADI